jgi:hypothetical protein
MVTLGALLVLQCQDDPPGQQSIDHPACDVVRTSAEELVEEYKACDARTPCTVFPIGEQLQAGRGPCFIPFLCPTAIRANESTSLLVGKAKILLHDGGSCACATLNCPDPSTLEAYCHPVTSRCATRPKQP